MKTETTYCRISSSSCGLNAHVEQNRVVFAEGVASLPIPSNSERLSEPMKRVNGALTPVGWDEAISEIGEGLRKIRSQQGPEGIGLYLGERTQRSSRALIRSLAFGVGSGTPHIFSEANLSYGLPLWATEKMIGHAAALVSDLSRAHYVLLLSGEQRDLGWGPFSPGEGHEAWLQHSRKTKKTKVVVADPRLTELAETMDKHLQIRPGSEAYLMLGMLIAIVQRGWTDDQFLRDYTINLDKLKEAVAGWNVEECAAMCGIESAELSGIALKFARSPMALVHPARQSFQNEAGALGAWAWLALHAVTANILRPGGLYENRGVIDLFHVLSQLKTDKAPRNPSTGSPLLLMQASAAAMPAEITDGALRGLIAVSGNPVGRLPGPTRTRDALNALELLVYIGHHEDDTAALADWVLPASLPFEQSSMAFDETGKSSNEERQWSPPAGTVESQARSEDRILADIYAALRPGLRGSVWGRHLGVAAQFVARTDLEQWEQRFLSDWLSGSPDDWNLVVEDAFAWPQLLESGGVAKGERRLHIGDGDRSLWRPSTDSQKIDLVAPDFVPLIRGYRPRAPDDLVVRTGQWRERFDDDVKAPAEQRFMEVRIHPDMGFEQGSRVEISTEFGSCSATVVLDEQLRSDVVDLPFYEGCSSLELLDGNGFDPLGGTAVMDGLKVSISSL